MMTLKTNWIVENYDPDLVEALQVSHRDGHYYVLDGQHTLKALKEVFSDDNFRVLCKVYHRLTESEEAQLFCDFNERRKKVNSAELMKARAVAGDASMSKFLI